MRAQTHRYGLVKRSLPKAFGNLRRQRRNVPRLRTDVAAQSVFGVLAICSALAAGCNSTSGSFSNSSGSAYYRQGNYAAARHKFQQAVFDNPHRADYAHNLAAAVSKQGDPVGAEQAYRHALSLDPGHQPSYHGLAMLLNSQGRTDEATALLDGWTATQPNSAAAHVERAWLHREQANYVAAEQSLRQALTIQPNNPVALAQMGRIYEETGQRPQAVAHYQRSLQNHWGQPIVQSRLASLQWTRTAQAQPFANRPGPRWNTQPSLMAGLPTSRPGTYGYRSPSRGSSPYYAYPDSPYPGRTSSTVPDVAWHPADSGFDADPAHSSVQ